MDGEVESFVKKDAETPIKEFSTGAKRSAEAENEAWELVPILGLKRVAVVAAYGAKKYGIGNWLKGMPVAICLRRAIRHCYLFLLGDRSEDHLAHAAWNLLAACQYEMTHPELVEVDLVWQDPDGRRKSWVPYGEEARLLLASF